MQKADCGTRYHTKNFRRSLHGPMSGPCGKCSSRTPSMHCCLTAMMRHPRQHRLVEP
ncbi:hypothetical protein V5799_021744, partial [Amblyomma americanum]